MDTRARAVVGCLMLSACCAIALAAPPDAQAILSGPANGVKESGTSLTDVFDHLRHGSQRPVFVSWRPIEAAGIKRTLPVTVDLSGLTVGEAFGKLLGEVNGPTAVPLGFVVDDGVVTVSTAEDLARVVDTRTYDVRTLIGPTDAGRAARVEKVTRRVLGIQPLTWRDNGDNIGSVKELSGQLIVTHTPEMQKRIADELADAIRTPRADAAIVPPPAQPAPAVANGPAAPPTPMAKTAAALERHLPEVRFAAVTLADAIDFVQQTSGVAFDVDWDELAKPKLTQDTPVSVRMRNVSVAKVLQVVLAVANPSDEPVPPANEPATTITADGHVLVTTRGKLFGPMATPKRYPVGDLLGPAGNKDRPAVQKQIGELVTKTIAIGMWAEAGEPGGTLAFDGDEMVVAQTPEAHKQIVNLLGKLRPQLDASSPKP